MTKQVIEIPQEEALEAIKRVEGDSIHCFIGAFGADWDKDAVVALVKGTKRIAWAEEMFGHNLAVIRDGNLHRFDIKYDFSLPCPTSSN